MQSKLPALPLIWFGCLLLLELLLGAQLIAAEPMDPSQVRFFEQKVRPLLVKYCYECHSQQGDEIEAGLALDSREGWQRGGDSGPAVAPGNVAESLLLQAVRYEDLEMPPDGKLADSEIASLETWVKMGAPDPRDSNALEPNRAAVDLEKGREFWAFQPPQTHPMPVVRDVNWSWCDIDRFILARLEQDNLKPSRDAEERTWLRRVTYDLTGLPPTSDDIARFLRDTSRAGRERLVDRLLNSSQFGEHWGRHWLDVARYADSNGSDFNATFYNAWRYRNYVIGAFNADRPFNEFIREQLAGDLLPYADDDQRSRQLVATGFLMIGPKMLSERDKAKLTMDVVDEQIDTVGRAFLGLTLGCARCHDHKFDPIGVQDYYALAGIFRSSVTLQGESQQYVSAWPETALPIDVGHATKLKQFQQHEATLVKEIAAAKEQQLAAEQELANLTEMVDAVQSISVDQKQFTADEDEDANRSAATALAQAKAATAASEIEQLESRLKALRANAPPPPPKAMAVRDRSDEVQDCEICIRGDHRNLGPAVPRGFVRVLSNESQPVVDGMSSGRIELADWVASGHNPLTARVIVNRVWRHLVGEGIVRSVDNFGQLGQRPTHPELLDQLAVEFMRNDWSIKRLVRRICLSRTYAMGSLHDEVSYGLDPENRLLWRMHRKRLTAEQIRDSLLTASGQLDLAPGKSPVADLDALAINNSANQQGRSGRSGHLRRSVYLPIVRNDLPEILTVFDFADPDVVTGRRPTTNVPAQSLLLLNSPFVQACGQRTAAQVPGLPDDAARLEQLYSLVLGRLPSRSERERSMAYLRRESPDGREQAWSRFVQALFASTEFRMLN